MSLKTKKKVLIWTKIKRLRLIEKKVEALEKEINNTRSVTKKEHNKIVTVSEDNCKEIDDLKEKNKSLRNSISRILADIVEKNKMIAQLKKERLLEREKQLEREKWLEREKKRHY